MKSIMLFLLFCRSITKVGVFGGALYFVITKGFWSDNKEYPSIKALQDFNQKADDVLGGKYLSQVVFNYMYYDFSQLHA